MMDASDTVPTIPGRVLSRTMIAREAFAMLKTDGLDGISLRRLAARLNVKAPSLYWHVRNKSDLLALVVEDVFAGSLKAMPASHNWRDWLIIFGERLWQVQRSVRDLSRLIMVAGPSEEKLDELIRPIIEALSGFGLAVEDANEFQSAVQAYVIGWASLASGVSEGYLRRHIDIDRAFLRGLRSLVAGFEPQQGATEPPGGFQSRD